MKKERKEAIQTVAQHIHDVLSEIERGIVEEGFKPEYSDVFLNIQTCAYDIVSFMSEKAFAKLREQEQAIEYALEDFENGISDNIAQTLEPIVKGMDRAAKRMLEANYKIQNYNKNKDQADKLVQFYIAVDKEVSKNLVSFISDLEKILKNDPKI